MNIFSLTGLIAVLGLITTIVLGLIKKPQNWFISFSRYFLAVFFIFSGTVKAIDPIGTAIKMEEYFLIFTEYSPSFMEGLWNWCAHMALPISIIFIVLEIALGIALIVGIFKRSTLALYAFLVLFFTFLTGFSAWTGKVTDCGCFGDFVKLKPFESFLKDLFLMAMVTFIIGFKNHITPLFKKPIGAIALGVLTLASLAFCLRNYYNLPIKDFRAYKVGTDLVKGKSFEGMDEGESKIYYTLVNASKEEKEVESKEYMDKQMWKDKSWKIDKTKTRTVVIREPELPKIKDFMIYDDNSNELADKILAKPGHHFFVASYDIGKADAKGYDAINAVLKPAAKDNVTAIGLTSSPIVEANKNTDGSYDFYNLDATPIKTMIRANPGLVLIKDGVLVGKWHWNHIPPYTELKKQFGIKQQAPPQPLIQPEVEEVIDTLMQEVEILEGE